MEKVEPGTIAEVKNKKRCFVVRDVISSKDVYDRRGGVVYLQAPSNKDLDLWLASFQEHIDACNRIITAKLRNANSD